MKVINLFGGPGTGKSTCRAGIFYLMKSREYNIEEVTEYAKDITWEGTQILLSDQLYVLANQNRRLERLRDKVEVCVSDSPLLLTINYVNPNYLPLHFQALTYELWNTYDNINIFLNRKKKYNPNGRNQSYEEAVKIDKNIKRILIDNDINYVEVDADQYAPMKILKYYEEMK